MIRIIGATLNNVITHKNMHLYWCYLAIEIALFLSSSSVFNFTPLYRLRCTLSLAFHFLSTTTTYFDTHVTNIKWRYMANLNMRVIWIVCYLIHHFPDNQSICLDYFSNVNNQCYHHNYIHIYGWFSSLSLFFEVYESTQ